MFLKRRVLFLSLPALILAAAWIGKSPAAKNQRPAAPLPEASKRGLSVARPAEDSSEGKPRNWSAEASTHWDKSTEELPSTDWIRDFTSAWFFDEGPACLEKIRAEPPGPFRDACLRMAMAAWASGEPEDALDWLTRFPETSLATLARSEAIRVWTLDKPSAAARWLETSQLDKSELEIQKQTLVSAWMKLDSTGALRWVAKENDPATLAALRERAAMATRPEDREKTAIALMDGSTDPWRDPALESLSRSWIMQEPETAESWLRKQGADDSFFTEIKTGLVHPDDVE